jgi:hypothetical protein
VAVPSFNSTTFSQNAALLGVTNNVGYSIDPNIKRLLLQWNLSVQHDLGQGNSLTVRYVGNHGVGLFRAVDVNQVLLNQNGFWRTSEGEERTVSSPESSRTTHVAVGGTATQCGQFNPLPQPNLKDQGSQRLTIFPNICGPTLNGFIGQAFQSQRLGFLTTTS